MSRSGHTYGLTEAELAAIMQASVETQRALQGLARQLAHERGIELSAPEPDQPRPKSKSYRPTNLTRGEDGGLTCDVEYGDGSKRRFRATRNQDGDLEGELDDADAEMAQTADAGEAPSSAKPGLFEGLFGTLEGT
jgi:hypothetical protein